MVTYIFVRLISDLFTLGPSRPCNTCKSVGELLQIERGALLLGLKAEDCESCEDEDDDEDDDDDCNMMVKEDGGDVEGG